MILPRSPEELRACGYTPETGKDPTDLSVGVESGVLLADCCLPNLERARALEGARSSKLPLRAVELLFRALFCSFVLRFLFANCQSSGALTSRETSFPTPELLRFVGLSA